MTVDRLIRESVDALASHYSRSEARAMVEIALEHYKHWSRTDIICRGDWEVTEMLQEKISSLVERLLKDEPLQYILGSARFHGLDFKVTPDVLIPRPETAQLVDMIVDRVGSRSDLNILDIGTGSGAIAVALARNLPFANVEGIDISEKALEVARENSRNLKVDVKFSCENIFNASLPPAHYNIIVSNPPYITESEKKDMEPNVLLYEPSQALFVSDSDPLVYYRHITMLAVDSLSSGGLLAFEINRDYGKEIVALLTDSGFIDVDLVKDSFANDRFVFGYKPNID